MRQSLLYFILALSLANMSMARAAETASTLPRADANGNPLRHSPTGHVSNYDEAKVGNYTLPDPLVLRNGQPVRDAETWIRQRRPEILKLYETEVYGRVPPQAPPITFAEAGSDLGALSNSAIRKDIVGQIGDLTNGPKFGLVLYLPANTTGPVPVLLHVMFGNPPAAANSVASTPAPRPGEVGPIADILARGYGYAMFRYTEIEGDSRTNNQTLVRRLALAPGYARPAPDEWGTITAWAWAASRVLDYLETCRAVDAKRVALIGHSRLGKTALWAGARDPRFALVFASCSGELGASLARRDYGETVDDVIANFPWWFANNFQKYSRRWNDLPVDSHLLIALNAPHPVFITGGTEDQWADPRGMFLAAVAAGPVYRLLGKQDLGTTELPPLDRPLIAGDLGFLYHTGPHSITAEDWKVFLDFADRHLKPTR
jgi:hypothetical protein